MDQAGIQLEEDEFRDLFQAAAERDAGAGGGNGECCCVETFMKERHARLA